MKKKESGLKIHKGRLGFNRGYPSWKPAKDGSNKRGNHRKVIKSWKSPHQRDEMELEILLKRIKIVRHDSLLGELFQKLDPDNPNVHYSNDFLYL